MRERLEGDIFTCDMSQASAWLAEDLIKKGWVHIDYVKIDEEKIVDLLTFGNNRKLASMIAKSIAEARPLKVRGE